MHREPADAAPVVGSLLRDAVCAVLARHRSDEACERWVQAARAGGRSGWLPLSRDVELREAVRTEAAETPVMAAPGDRGEPLRVLRRRTPLDVLGRADCDGEPWVRVRLRTGHEGFLPGRTRVTDASRGTPLAPTLGGTFDPRNSDPRVVGRGIDALLVFATTWLARRGLVGGGVLMAASATWFFWGLSTGYVYFAPPVVFAVGLLAAALGLGREKVAGGLPVLRFVPR